jgi:hypothetical protein
MLLTKFSLAVVDKILHLFNSCIWLKCVFAITSSEGFELSCQGGVSVADVWPYHTISHWAPLASCQGENFFQSFTSGLWGTKWSGAIIPGWYGQTAAGNRYSLRADTELLLQVPATRRSFGDRAFFTAGPTLWNRLPQSIGVADNLPSFKSLLKTHLFFECYCNITDVKHPWIEIFSLNLWRYISNLIDW